MKDLIKAYKALSDESRLRVLNLFFERECCVCEIEQVLEISQSKASRICSTLHDAGFLSLRKEGLWSLYSIDWGGMDANLKSILEATGKNFEKDTQMTADRKTLSTAERISPCCQDSCSNQTSEESVLLKS